MGKIKVLKKSTLSGRTENDDYKIYPVTKTDAVFTDDEDKDECDTQTPQGANKTTKEILNSIRKKGWVNNERIKDGAVTKNKLSDDILNHLDNTSGSLKALAFKDNASGSYTPAGSVSQPTFTGSEGSVSVSGSAYVLPKAELTIVDPNSVDIPVHKEGDSYIQGAPIAKVAGADVALNTSSISQITDVGTLPALTVTVSDENLIIDWSAGTLPTKAEVTVATSVKSVTQPTVTIGAMDITFQSSTATVNSTGKFTPSGNVSKPTFAGTATTITVK